MIKCEKVKIVLKVFQGTVYIFAIAVSFVFWAQKQKSHMQTRVSCQKAAVMEMEVMEMSWAMAWHTLTQHNTHRTYMEFCVLIWKRWGFNNLISSPYSFPS